MNEASSKKQFFSGLTALTLSGAAVKVIGMLCKIPLFHILGDVGMGYYNSAYELYTLFFVISTSGLPVALSIMVSESIAGGRTRNTERILRITSIIFVIVGLCGSLIMAFGAETFAGFLGNPNAKFCILVISPTIFFICVSSVQRGYFQGCGNMVPTSVSQVIEAFSKLIFGIALAFLAVSAGKDSSVSSAYAVVGLTVGTGLSMVYLILTKNHHGRLPSLSQDSRTDSYPAIIKTLCLLALPVTLSSSLSSLSRVADMAILQRRLVDIGFDAISATAVYGSYSTLALPIYNLPMTAITAVSVSLVPLLAAAVESHNAEKAVSFIQTAFRICAMIAVPCSFGISVFSRQILGLVFRGETEAINVAAPCLSILGLSVFASCLLTVTNSVLQAYHKAFLPTISMAVGCFAKIIFAYILIGIPGIGVLGAAISTLACNLLAVALNLHYIDKHTEYSGNIASVCLPPILSSIISVAAAVVFYFFIKSVGANDVVALLASIMLCVVVYVFVSLKNGTLLCDDIEMLPGGDKMLKILTKLCIINNKKDTNNEQRRKNGKTVAEGKLQL